MQNFDYFLGTVSASGFAGFFSQLNDPDLPERTRIIKSGPGCGKSSMMRRLGERMVRAGYPVEYIHCSSDPDSLDGLVCVPLRFAIVDGTAPHVLEPAIPAAKQEVVSLIKERSGYTLSKTTLLREEKLNLLVWAAKEIV